MIGKTLFRFRDTAKPGEGGLGVVYRAGDTCSLSWLAVVALQLLIPWIASPLVAAESPQPTSLADLSWITGDWVGGEGDSFIEEQWSAPEGDAMMGMFRLIQEDNVVFYEFMTITPGPSGIELRIKHFDPGLVGWEERADSIVFDLQEIGDYRAVFETEKDGNPERLVYERSRDELVITLEKPADGTRTPFRYRRKSP